MIWQHLGALFCSMYLSKDKSDSILRAIYGLIEQLQPYVNTSAGTPRSRLPCTGSYVRESRGSRECILDEEKNEELPAYARVDR